MSTRFLPEQLPSICLAAILAMSAHAADTTLAVVVVTAQRRSEPLQRVPVSISVIDSQTIYARNIQSMQDLGAIVPSLVTTNSVNYGQAPLSIRGVGGANGGGNTFSDEPVALYSNDVFVSKVRFATAEFVDVESIQILRGPQGTLYGRNATAGALLVTTAAPTAGFTALARGYYSSIGESQVQAVISGPAAPTLLGRMALAYSDHAGWASNTVNGQRLGMSRNITARTSWHWNSYGSIKADLIADYQKGISRPMIVALADLAQLANPSPPNLVTPYRLGPDAAQLIMGDQTAYNSPTYSRTSDQSVTLKFAWNVGAVELTSVSGWRSSEVLGTQDSDATALNVISNAGGQSDQQWSQELRVNNKTPARLGWLAGAIWYHEQNHVDSFTIFNQLGFLGAGTAARFAPEQALSAWGLFADATLRLSNRWSVEGGGRLSGEEKDFMNLVTARTIRTVTAPAGVLAPVAVTVPLGTIVAGPTAASLSGSWRNLSPRVVVKFDDGDHVMAYASFSMGFKSGGFNAFGTAPAFRPERIDAFELGLKSYMGNGRIILNAAVFKYDYRDLQVRLPVPTGGVDIRNAAAATVHGAEVEFTVQATNSVRMQGSLAWLIAKFTKGTLPSVPATFTFGPPTALANEDIRGNSLSRAPKWQFQLSATYDKMLAAWGTLEAQVNNRYQSAVVFLETQQSGQTFRAGAWSELGVRVGLKPTRSRWEVAILGRNILDNRHVTQVAAYGGLPVAAVNQPTSWALQMNYDLR